MAQERIFSKVPVIFKGVPGLLAKITEVTVGILEVLGDLKWGPAPEVL